jgi:phage tail sheath protein FI
VNDAERSRLGQMGVNTLNAVRSITRARFSLRTLAGGSSGSSDWKYLGARRLALFIVTSIERGTRWVVFETSGPELWQRVTLQVEAFLAGLDHEGAFVGREDDETFFVICDERINAQADVRTGTVNVLVGFAALRPGEYHAYLITHDAAGSRVRPVSVNRFETGGRRLERAMEVVSG